MEVSFLIKIEIETIEIENARLRKWRGERLRRHASRRPGQVPLQGPLRHKRRVSFSIASTLSYPAKSRPSKQQSAPIRFRNLQKITDAALLKTLRESVFSHFYRSNYAVL